MPACPTWVVIPTYQERHNLERLLVRLRAAREGLRVLVVDDSSPDGTAELAEELGRRLGGVQVLRRPARAGLASAYLDGFRLAMGRGAQRIVQMDADLSHDPADVPRLLDAGADLVLGSRYVPGGGTRNWPLRRRALSRFGSLWSRGWLGLPLHDLTGGFKAWRRPALACALSRKVRSRGYAFQVEMTWAAVRGGFSVAEVPIVFTERSAGSSKMSRSIALEAAWLVPWLRLRG